MRKCHCRYSVIAAGVLVAATACRQQPQPVPLPASGAGPQAVQLGAGGPADGSDVEKVRDADVSILFVGNSHTMMHDVPGLVARMIQFRQPEKRVYTHFVWVGFLED